MTQKTPCPGNDSIKYALNVKNLSKDYTRGKGKPALQNLSLEIRSGEIYGFLGPNGAGKTTTIKSILGLIIPDSGEISILNFPHASVEIRARLGYLPEEACFSEFLTAEETLISLASLSEVKNPEEKIQSILSTVKLEGFEKRIVKTFSKGMKQRLGMAQALIHDPDILILDEPLTGLDPLGRRMMKEIILEARNRGKTIFLSSHQLLETEQICDRIGILCNGKLVHQSDVKKDSSLNAAMSPLEELFIDILRSNGYE
ncbi:MAG: ABC transporter ATP-binding protein [Candidatus Wallbacteria bacterium HGW-Wallbacteria-1]|jgi:ABC-2 type transport system ATP-binding protein|uniref:ABC transporter ATP-binding protein n=1 Tax=Candidatus Wallbacteria bacterium HGW-Wallbacteria-1 TaxID=2013854 RepID=A0A2N1PSB4_9BACT|nr:MAG: ABC transporter ATP-binding protein [Candidatus Wallbacteria bacterium HGW-Wallbacteria-1]